MITGEVDDRLGLMDAIEALKELTGNRESALIAVRASERVDIQTDVVFRPGNASERNRYAHQAITADVSDGGCMLISPSPAIPGDIYWLEFSDEHLRVGSLFVRCMRCRMVSEGVFELGVKFMVPIDLESALVITKPNTEDASQ